jgi:hypothetical protein
MTLPIANRQLPIEKTFACLAHDWTPLVKRKDTQY